MRKTIGVLVLAVMLGVFGGYTAQGAEDHNKEHYELAEALERAKVSLAQGLMASQPEGTPISGKFEVEDGKLQLSVYTMKGDTFSEVIIDHTTGNIAKVEAITSGDDLTAAKNQSAAMAKSMVSLREVIEKAVKANQGFTAVRVIPSLKEGHPSAEVSLINDAGEELKTVSEPLF